MSSSPIAGHSRTDECLCPIWQRGEGQRPGPPATHPFPHRPQVVRGRQPAGPTSSAVLRHHPGGRVVPASRRCTPGPRHRTSAQTRSGRGGRANGLPAAAFPGPPLRIHLAGRQRGLERARAGVHAPPRAGGITLPSPSASTLHQESNSWKRGWMEFFVAAREGLRTVARKMR